MEKMIDFIFSKKFSIQKEINLSCFTYTQIFIRIKIRFYDEFLHRYSLNQSH